MSLASRKRVTALASVGVIGAMLGLSAAAVPLYDWFCRVTGFGGTTQVAEGAVDVEERTVTVRFNADRAPDLPWAFQPVQREMTVRVGEQSLAFYRAVNRADHPVVGSATFNVTPHKAGLYFSKIHCFCFEEQLLAPGEEIDMPVSFFVDPEILDDPSTADVTSITLSYTFFKREDVEDGGRMAEAAP
jgi:cytochrome c oxidase assembly protein subunit 11